MLLNAGKPESLAKENATAPAPRHASDAQPAIAPTAQLYLSFLWTSACFLLGLSAAIGAVDYRIGLHYRHVHGMGLIGAEVYQSISRAQKKSSKVRSLYLGDSVARQLLMPGTEPTEDARFLTANQAISMAGQYRLLEIALAAHRSVRDVYLIYIPGCFGNNLSPRLSPDYYCGFFHRPRDIVEIFRLKHDSRLTASQVGRMLMPNLMFANSWWNLGSADEGSQGNAIGGIRPPAPDPEPILSLLDWALGKAPDPPEQPAGTYGPTLPPVSRHYLAKFKLLCQKRGARLHVLPSPLSTREDFQDPQHVFDVPPLRVDPVLLMDAVHVEPPQIKLVRERMIKAYHLPLVDVSR